MTFTEEWFPFASQIALAGIGVLIADVKGMIVEIGSWEGRSTASLANAINPRVVHAVDTWAGSPGEPSATLAAQRDVYEQFQTNMKELTAGNVTPHRMDWRTFVPHLGTKSVALVFIDAEHSYGEVFDTVQAFKPLMAPGGVMCGDDVHHGPVQSAVLASFPDEEIIQVATMWVRQS